MKTSDSLNYYLKELEDEISGDVGQEVELVAHAPMYHGGRVAESDHYGSSRRHHPSQAQQNHPHARHHGGIPSYSRSTPPRHQKSVDSRSGSDQKSGSGGRRRKRHTGSHVPSNSGKVQLDLTTLGGEGMSAPALVEGADVTPGFSNTPRSSPPLPTTLPCGVMLTSPLRRSGSGLHRAVAPCVTAPPTAGSLYSQIPDSSPTSPVFSLDLDKMSLCGTENVSQMGGSIGGASLCNVFDDHEDSVVGATLMDMTVSVGSNPSGGGSSGNYSPQSGLGLHQAPQTGMNPHHIYGDNESLIGVSSAIMDFSVGSGVHSKEQGYARNNDNESFIGVSSTGMDMSVGSNAHSKGECAGSSQNSSSGGSSSKSSGSRRSGSPASIDKASLNLCEDGGRASLSE